jgi:hypothetical protein
MRTLKHKNAKWWIGAGSFILLFAGIGTFAYMKMDFILKGVQIEAVIDHTNTASSLIQIKGNAKNAVYLSLNGREIFIDENGMFTEPVVLLPGLGVVTLEAQDKFGKSSEKKFEIVYADESPTVALVPITSSTN